MRGALLSEPCTHLKSNINYLFTRVSDIPRLSLDQSFDVNAIARPSTRARPPSAWQPSSFPSLPLAHAQIHPHPYAHIHTPTHTHTYLISIARREPQAIKVNWTESQLKSQLTFSTGKLILTLSYESLKSSEKGAEEKTVARESAGIFYCDFCV